MIGRRDNMAADRGKSHRVDSGDEMSEQQPPPPDALPAAAAAAAAPGGQTSAPLPSPHDSALDGVDEMVELDTLRQFTIPKKKKAKRGENRIYKYTAAHCLHSFLIGLYFGPLCKSTSFGKPC